MLVFTAARKWFHLRLGLPGYLFPLECTSYAVCKLPINSGYVRFHKNEHDSVILYAYRIIQSIRSSLGTWLLFFSVPIYTEWMENSWSNVLLGESTPQYKNKVLYEHRPSAAKIWPKCPPWFSTSEVSRVKSFRLTQWIIPGVTRIISNPFCVRCYKSWPSLTAVAHAIDGTCFRRWKCKGLKSGERAGHDVGPTRRSRWSKIPELQEESVVEHHHAWTVNEVYPADPCLTTASERLFEGNRGKEPPPPQSEVVEESRVPEVCLLQCQHGNSRWTFWAFSLIVRRLQVINNASEGI